MIRILVVDDSPTMRKMVRAALLPTGAEFCEAANGLEALEQLAMGEHDVMVLDMNMPDMHGLEVIQHTRALQQYASLPILVLTTRADAQTRETALTSGANRYLTKPFVPAQLLAEVEALLAPA